jgi:multidrug efflux pump subunit AcrA (membrane-fusion protein)
VLFYSFEALLGKNEMEKANIMSENQQDNQPLTVSPTPAEATPTEHMIPKSRFDEVNNQLRELKAQLEQTQSERQRQAEQKLAEEKRWQELAEQRQVEIEKLTSIQDQVTRYQSALQATNEARLAQIPEDKLTLVPEYDDPVKLGAWLDANIAIITEPSKPRPPSLNGGSGSAGNDAPALPAGVQNAMDLARQYTGLTLNEERVAQLARRPIKPTDLEGKG